MPPPNPVSPLRHPEIPVNRRLFPAVGTPGFEDMTEIAVIGAGINGLMSAYFLRQSGYRVTVLDQGPIPNPEAASHGQHRLLQPWSASADPVIARRAVEALAMWPDILSDISFDGLAQTGVFAVAPFDNFETLDAGIVCERITARELGRLCPMFSDENENDGVLFPQFGILFASGILGALADHLLRQGVRMRPDTAVRSVDYEQGAVTLRSNETQRFDHVLLCAGTGTTNILRNSPGEVPELPVSAFSRQRCFVLYGAHPGYNDRTAGAPAWASLGTGDLWGMPPVRGLPMKLGCGTLTHDPDARAQMTDRQILQHFREEYRRACQTSDLFEPSTLAFNHWTRINTDKTLHPVGRCHVITADNGAGFKYGPLVGKEAAEAIEGRACRSVSNNSKG